jgi:thiol-disulfide isomerase/thioredoxin
VSCASSASRDTPSIDRASPRVEGAAPSAPAPAAQPIARLAVGPGADKTDVSSLVGKPAPAWALATWFNSEPLQVEQLQGRVVLVRWLMSSECQYCSATAPALVELHDAYADKGLTVVGMYHHKSEGPLVVDDVRELVQDHYRFRFPVAIDDEWKTLKQWWLDAHPTSWTSVSFLVDRRGVVRFAHLGGEFPPGSADNRQMRAWIDELIAEPASAR